MPCLLSCQLLVLHWWYQLSARVCVGLSACCCCFAASCLSGMITPDPRTGLWEGFPHACCFAACMYHAVIYAVALHVCSTLAVALYMRSVALHVRSKLLRLSACMMTCCVCAAFCCSAVGNGAHQVRPPLPYSLGWLFHTVSKPMLVAGGVL